MEFIKGRKFSTDGHIVGKEFFPAKPETKLNGEIKAPTPARCVLHLIVGELENDMYTASPAVAQVDVPARVYAAAKPFQKIHCGVTTYGNTTVIRYVKGMDIIRKEEDVDLALMAMIAEEEAMANKNEIEKKAVK